MSTHIRQKIIEPQFSEQHNYLSIEEAGHISTVVQGNIQNVSNGANGSDVTNLVGVIVLPEHHH